MTEHRAGRILGRLAVYSVAAAGLIWVFHDVKWAEVARSFVRLRWGWAVLAALFVVLSYASQGYRWHLLLKPLGDIGPLRTTQAVYSGLFINEVVPMRIGEVARAYLVSLWMKKGIVSVVPSMALERLFEGIWLAAGIGVTAILVPLPRKLVRAGDIFGAVVLVLTGVVLYLTLRKERQKDPELAERPVRWPLLRRLLSVPGRLEGGLRSIGISRYSVGAFFVSLLLFVFQAFSVWFVMKAYGLGLSFWVGAAVFLIIHFGTALPNAPANVGTYQLFCVLALTLFNVDKTTAAGFSIVIFLLLTIPLWVIGFFALGQTGLKISDIKERYKNLRKKI